MKYINKNTLTLLIFLGLFYYVFTNSTIVSQNIIDSLLLFITNVFPFLFPSLVLTNILILNNLPYYLCKYIRMSSSTYIFLMSLITGCPSNAIMIESLLKEGNVTEDDAERVLCYTMFNNPIFLYNTLLLTFNKSTSIQIILINYIANLFIFLLIRPKRKEKFIIHKNKESISSSIILSISKATSTLFMIMGTIVFFNILPVHDPIIKGMIEVTKGLTNLPILAFYQKTKVVLASIFISFGGVSILMQIKSILKDTSIKYMYFFKYRIIHVLLVSFLNYIV